jgi:site-specific DNA-methyltransferase (adenine-specific)
MMPQTTVHLGEALLCASESYAFLRGLASNSVDALITDPPYCSGGAGSAAKAAPSEKYVQGGQALQWLDFAGDQRDMLGFIAWSTLWLSECHRVLKPGGRALVFTDWRMFPAAAMAFQSGGFIWRGTVVWDKQRARPQKGYFVSQSEYILWGSKGKLNTEIAGDLHQLPGVIRCPVERPGQKLHMTGKPLDLMRELVKCVPDGGTVLDPFMGSASTGVAAIERGLKFIGCEMVPGIFEIAEKRIQGLVS